MYVQLGSFPVVMCIDSLSDRQVSQAIYFLYSLFQLVVQGFSPTANLSWISLQFYVLVSHSFHVVESVLSFATLSLFNDQIINRHIFLPNIIYNNILQILVLLKHFIRIKTSIISLLCFLCLKEM